jgi:hypothetical protein
VSQRKVLATIGTGAMHDVLTESLNTFRQFASVHSYDVMIGTDDRAGGRATAWAKVPLIRELLDAYEYVLWIDSDAIVLDWSVDPVDLLRETDYQALVSVPLRDLEIPCTGVWLLRSTSKSKAFLDAVWATEGDEHWEHPWEQAPVTRLLGYSVETHKFVGPTEWTVGTLWLDDEWDTLPIATPARQLTPCRIRHYAGVSNEVRRRRMRADQHGIAADRSAGVRSLAHRTLAIFGDASWAVLGDVGNYTDEPDLQGRLRSRYRRLKASARVMRNPFRRRPRSHRQVHHDQSRDVREMDMD